MSIERSEVERVARLACVAVDPETLPALTRQIADILKYVSQLERAVPDAGADVVSWLGTDQPLPPREDVVHAPDLQRGLRDFAPAFQDGLLLVPRLPAMDQE